MTEHDHASSRRRMTFMALVALAVAIIAFLTGFPRAAFGVAAGLPVALFNHFLMVRASRRAAQAQDVQKQMAVLQWSFVRMGISMAALLASIRLGPEFIIGMLVGLVSEVFTHMADVVRMIFRTRR